ncbi:MULTISPECIES: hypothetical protein [Paenibacillus]|nr:hypothetical protein [Paenibacillus caseinilyticus]MCZ8520346.1 hypothetical protein [Paenibacillus caseinilyticus]
MSNGLLYAMGGIMAISLVVRCLNAADRSKGTRRLPSLCSWD